MLKVRQKLGFFLSFLPFDNSLTCHQHNRKLNFKKKINKQTDKRNETFWSFNSLFELQASWQAQVHLSRVIFWLCSPMPNAIHFYFYFLWKKLLWARGDLFLFLTRLQKKNLMRLKKMEYSRLTIYIWRAESKRVLIKHELISNLCTS